jgi:octaprenyl-diphosphate synthase
MPERKNQVFSVWGDFLRRLHLGQAMDIRWHRDFYSLPSLDEYYTMCSLKTGCLARLAAVLGVSAAFSSPVPHTVEMRDVEKSLMERFGTAAEKLGVGFQILDDVKNLVSGVPGKKRGDDIVEGKKSLPVLLYLHQKPEKMEFTSRCFTAARKGGSSVPEVEKLITELSSGGFLKKAEEKGQALIREAQEQFSSNFPKPAASSETENARKLLAGLTDLIS